MESSRKIWSPLVVGMATSKATLLTVLLALPILGAIQISAQIRPRSKTSAIAGGNKGPAESIPIEDCSKCRIKDNNSITIDGVIDITHETSQAPNPEFRWI